MERHISPSVAVTRLATLAVCAMLSMSWSSSALAEEWVALELYVSGEEGRDVQTWAEAALEDRDGVSLRVYDLSADNGGRERFESICSYYKLDSDDSAPLLYGCGATIRQPESEEQLARALDEMLTVTVFVQGGCPRCARAKQFFEPMMRNYPGFEVVYRDVARDAQASRDMNTIARRYRQNAVVPVFHFCNQVIVGFDRDTTTGRRLESAFDHWTFARDDMSSYAPDANASQSTRAALSAPSESPAEDQVASVSDEVTRSSAVLIAVRGRVPAMPIAASLIGFSEPEETDTHGRDPPDSGQTADDAADVPPPLPLPAPPPLPLPDPLPLPLPLPPDDDSSVSDDTGDAFVASPFADSAAESDLIHVPGYGDVSASELSSRYGLPVFTIIIGLIDGFNPCAMWVLMFLLSLLVNLKSRWKMFAVAGTFVVISGLAYFAFMVAWLTFFTLIGLLRPTQIVLGLLAVGVALIHIKDFFAFKQGISLSIPEGAKPGIYARVRRIVMAENIWGAIAGASVLAVLINIIELLCTAGLPAIYTKVLSDQQLAAWKEYAYIGLYNVAYMFDDGLMVAIAVWTLGSHKLQESGGRWLKLVSGVVVLALGLVLLFEPELLEFGLAAE